MEDISVNNLVLDSNKMYALFVDPYINRNTFMIDSFDNNYGYIYESKELFQNNSDNIFIINQHLLQ